MAAFNVWNVVRARGAELNFHVVVDVADGSGDSDDMPNTDTHRHMAHRTHAPLQLHILVVTLIRVDAEASIV